MNTTLRMKGITILEVLIAFAIVAVLLGSTLPDTASQIVRTNVDQSLLIAAEAQKALVDTCSQNGEAVVTTNLEAEFFYIPSSTEQDHVSRILLGANCANDDMAVILWTSHTGAETDPVLELIAVPAAPGTDASLASGYTWQCNLIQGSPNHVPEDCNPLRTGG